MMQGGRTSTFSIALSSGDASETRDNIAKTLYHSIFSFLILRINERIASIESSCGDGELLREDFWHDPGATNEDRDMADGKTGGAPNPARDSKDDSSTSSTSSFLSGTGPVSASSPPSPPVLSTSASITSIGILDVFGFESFDASTSSFEHFGINYFSEKMHHKFIHDTASRTRSLLEDVGMDIGLGEQGEEQTNTR